jgi:hypothetical protein
MKTTRTLCVQETFIFLIWSNFFLKNYKYTIVYLYSHVLIYVTLKALKPISKYNKSTKYKK